jgi:hypothetical protein
MKMLCLIFRIKPNEYNVKRLHKFLVVFYYFFNIVGDVGRQKRPEKFEIIGSMVAVLGAVIIFYAPR